MTPIRIGALVALLSCPAPALVDSTVCFDEKLLMTLPEEFEVEHRGLEDPAAYDVERTGFPFVSGSGRDFAVVVKTPQGVLIQHGGDLDDRFKGLSGLFLSPDGKLAFSGRTAEGWQMVVGDSTGVVFEEMGPPVFSTQGKLAYAVSDAGAWRVIEGADKHTPFASVGEIVFSPDGGRLAYVAGLEGGKSTVVIDGDKGSPYDDVRSPVFNSSSRELSYIARGGSDWFVVKGSKRQASYSGIDQLVYAGRNITYCVQVDGGYRVVKRKKELAEVDWVSHLFVPPKAKDAVYATLSGGDFKLFKGSKSFDSFSLIGKDPTYFAFSRDTKDFAYIASSPFGKGLSIIEKGVPGRPWVRIHPQIWFAPKNMGFVYIAENEAEKLQVVRVTQKGHLTRHEYDDVYPRIHFDASGEKVAFCARIERSIWWMVRKMN